MPDHLRQSITNLFRNAASGVIYRRRADGCETVVRAAERGPLVALLLVVGLAIVFPARIWLVTAAGLSVLILICVGWTVACARGVKLGRQLRFTWVQVGDRLEEIFVLHNPFFLPILAAEIVDHSDLPGYDASTVRAVGGTSAEKWHQKAVSRQRGVFHLGPTTLRFSDPLGLVEATCEYEYRREVLVFPPVLHDLSVPAPVRGGHGSAASRLRKLTETPAIGSVRDYHPGDPIRRIHWPLSLRHGSFLIKEFDDEKGGDVWLALDLDSSVHRGEGQTSTLEYAIIWTASWAWHLLRQGKGVGLYTRSPAPVIVPPHQGSAHLWHILRALAPLEARARIPLNGLLREVPPLLARGHSLIIITPSASPTWPVELMTPGLRAAAQRVILLDAEAFHTGSVALADEDHPDLLQDSSGLAGMRSMLAGMGIPVTLVQPRKDFAARPVAPGTGDWEYVATGWGRVVVRAAPSEVKP